jgi:uncharacterized tellurite resistance protein B-like protein
MRQPELKRSYSLDLTPGFWPLTSLKMKRRKLRMLDGIKRYFNKATAEDSKDANQNAVHDTRVATCALFVEIARIDEKFTEAEMETILSILKQKYGLSQDLLRLKESSKKAWISGSLPN